MSQHRYSMVTIFPPSRADILELAKNMREDDAEEVALINGMTPIDAIENSIQISTICYAMRLKNGPLLCIGGAVRYEPQDGKIMANIWELGTGEIDRNPVTFHSNIRRALRIIMRTLPEVDTFVNMIPAKNTRYARWIESLGGTFDPKPFNVRGEPVRLFRIHRKEAPHV